MSNQQNNATFKAVFFCPPGVFALNGEQISSEKLLPVLCPPGKKPLPDDFKNSLADPTIDLSRVPTFFGTPPTQSSPRWFTYPGLDDLGDCIQYQFTDGTLITVREIFFHPYSLLVPPGLMPFSDHTRPEVLANNWLSLLPGVQLPLWGSLRKAELTLLSILLNTAQNKSVELWLTHSKDRETPRSAMQLKSIGILQEPQLTWKISSQGDWENAPERGWATISFATPTHVDQENQTLLREFILDSTEHSLKFHPYKRMIELVSQSIHHQLQGTPQNPTLKNLKFQIQGHFLIRQILHEVDQKLKIHGFPPVERTEFYEIAAVQVEPQVWIESEGKVRFCRKAIRQTDTLEVWNLPYISVSILDGLKMGLGATSAHDNKFLAQDRRGIKRDRDLKVLRHVGFFALIILETASYALKQQTFDGKPVSNTADFYTKLYARLGTLLYEVERKAGFVDLAPPPPLDKICSKNIIDLIQEYTARLIRLSNVGTDSIFTPVGEIALRGGTTAVLDFFHAILSRAATESKGLCFLKPKWNAFNSFFGEKENAGLEELLVREGLSTPAPLAAAQRYDTVSSWLSPAQVLHSLLPLREKGFALFYNGMPLNEMNISDFKPVFDLVENEAVEKADPKSSKSIDWFELHPKFFFKGVEVDTESLSRLSKDGVLEFQGKIYLIQNKNLPNVRRLEAFWAKIQNGKPSDSKRKSDDSILRLPKSQTLEMLALRATGVVVNGGPRWNKICHFYDSLEKPREPLVVPPSLKAELKPYQKTGVQWLLDLYELGLGGILADDMGLGKTIQTLSFLETLRIRNAMGATLIVVPTSLTYNWISESERFTPEIPTLIFQSKTKSQALEFINANPHSIIVCTYGLFTEHRDFFEKHPWNILVFDEAQNLKNISAKRTTASRMISANFKMCLTGTPLENHLGEFYSLLDLAVSGSLGEHATFREKFVTPDTIDPIELRYLKLKAKPLVLRRTKSEILTELPPKLESTIRLPFEQKQEKIYRDIALSWNEKVKGSILDQGESKSQLLMLTALLRLRQACSDPASIPNVKYTEEPPKVTVLLEALQEITESGESALVFTQFLHTFGRIKKELAAHNIESFSLHGGTSRPERERILREFQNSTKGSVLLMTLKTGGVGLNLVKASYVFHLEPWWNPAVENQASDRAHRLGQQKPVQVYRYLMKESVEEKIEILKERKSARFNSLFSSTDTESEAELSTGNSQLSQADFEYLLS